MGASGGIMGLIGFLFVLGLMRRRALPPGFVNRIAVSIALTALLGMVAWNYIDNAAHLGGLLAGAALGFLLTPTDGAPVLPLPRRAWVDQLGLVSALIVMAFAVLTGWKLMQFKS